ncbi:hypothetical protein M413DRAFT_348737 [Hebeloma cylindrosporum]|uniref:Uncharacterized protein n=1 Tax=Hebeloma cylindrosporum TaxID=76867 RepID=A0A0C2XBY3_HEBCY|nr:hypothetical protein M413DRAFT_348737 [Hebeloma cylindrosporum h7]
MDLDPRCITRSIKSQYWGIPACRVSRWLLRLWFKIARVGQSGPALACFTAWN